MLTKYNKGWENLRSLADVTPEERHSIQSSGGKASAAAKKERRRLEDLTHQILSKQLPDDEAIRGELEANGIDPTCDAGIVLAQVKRALNGDTKAAIWIRDILGENPGNRLTIDTDYLLTTPVANMDLSQLSDDELRAMIAAREELEEEGN